MTVDEIVRRLGLRPLEPEGGYFAETYRSQRVLTQNAAAGSPAGHRPLAAAIYYLLTPKSFSALHRIRSDEIYHFYLGDTVEMLLLYPDGSSSTLKLGRNILDNMLLQVAVPTGTWQGSRVVCGGSWALLGTTTAPGYDPADFELGKREELLKRYPDARDLIMALTR